MYLWNVEKISHDLRSGAVSQKEQMKYLLVLLVVLSVISYLGQYTVPPGGRNIFDFVMVVASMVISFAGVWWCYRANGGSDGKDFLLRFVCLSVPIGNKIAVAMLVFFLGVFMGVGVTDAADLGESSWMELVVTVVVCAVQFVWMRQKLVQIAKPHV